MQYIFQFEVWVYWRCIMRTNEDIKKEYKRWIQFATEDNLSEELGLMDDSEIEDAFFCDLTFGTGGLRGVIGAGTNRMNIYTVAKASQGLANYVKKHFSRCSIAVSYDSRIKSDLFSQIASSVFAANDIEVWLYPCLMPTPCLSYAVRTLDCSAGIMITASHNPSRYNGYKVYGADGCQITTEAAESILQEIKEIDVFRDVRSCSFTEALELGKVKYINASVYDAFTSEIKAQSVLFGDEINRDVAIVYSPMNGTGLNPIMRVLKESGFSNITVVEEQKSPDGRFPTCPYPNPEIRDAMQLGLKYCEKIGADLLLATDPDCDRCGIAIRGRNGYELITGNEIGLLLLDYICKQRINHGQMPSNPVLIKTIVTVDLAEKIAKNYGLEVINVLTGFKFIGEAIGKMEADGRESDYICGFEESYGYLTGTYVRDKDAVNAAFMICEMYAYYKTRGINLLEKLQSIYDSYGYCLNTLHSFEFEGSGGMETMSSIMNSLRDNVVAIGQYHILEVRDYINGRDGLPKSNVIKFILEKECSVTVRPSGTEPKLKLYFSIVAENQIKAKQEEQQLFKEISKLIVK